MPMVIRTLDEREARIHELLSQLDLLNAYGAERSGSLFALTDQETPNPHTTLASAGLPFASGATQRQISTYVAEYLGEPERNYDREIFRDYVLLPLREVGILEQLFVRPKNDLIGDPSPALSERGFWVPKSPTSSYILTADAETLILATAAKGWDDELAAFVGATPKRRERITQHRARVMLEGAAVETKHGLLIEAACSTLLDSGQFAGFELIFKDDGDDDRVKEPWATRLNDLGLTLDLSTRYPDAILASVASRSLWIVDAVSSDGEVDTIRFHEISGWASWHGWTIAGATTAYADYQTYSRRQGAMQNIAAGTTIWVAEDGGKLLIVSSLG